MVLNLTFGVVLIVTREMQHFNICDDTLGHWFVLFFGAWLCMWLMFGISNLHALMPLYQKYP